MKKSFLLFVSLLISLLATEDLLAAIKITRVTGASNYVEKKDNPQPIIYGGMVGDDCSNEADSEFDTCNNCEEDAVACNPVRIYPGLVLRIEFTSDSASGDAVIRADDNINGNHTTNVSKGSTARVEVTWGDLCQAISDDGDCTTNDSQTVRIGIASNSDSETLEDSAPVTIVVHDPSENGTIDVDTVDLCDTSPENGICDWRAYPGDEKIYLEALNPGDGSFPNSSEGLNFSHVRVYYSTTDFEDAVPGLASYKDIAIETKEGTSKSAIKNKKVEGLTNNQTYFFRIALVDPAKNVTYFTSSDAFDNKDDCQSGNDEDCDFMATPGEVVGMLTEDVNCFVTTAAFGSTWAPSVETFRTFRNHILLQKSWGQKLVKAYYEWGPKWAAWIAKSEFRRTVARAGLWPAWGMAYLSLKWGLGDALCILAITLLLPLLVWRFRAVFKRIGRTA